MRARKCDRFGCYYDTYQGNMKFEKTGRANALRLIDKFEDEKAMSRESYDLCPECMQELVEFLKIGGADVQKQ